MEGARICKAYVEDNKMAFFLMRSWLKYCVDKNKPDFLPFGSCRKLDPIYEKEDDDENNGDNESNKYQKSTSNDNNNSNTINNNSSNSAANSNSSKNNNNNNNNANTKSSTVEEKENGTPSSIRKISKSEKAVLRVLYDRSDPYFSNYVYKQLWKNTPFLNSSWNEAE